MTLPIITDLCNRQQFAELLKINPGLILIKFGADWCGPCKLIETDINNAFQSMPDTVQCVIVDIDKSIDLYAYFKMKRMVNGVPAVLCYAKENTSYVPDEAIGGADKVKLKEFFKTCMDILD